jgi:Ca2+-binding EF-hand superfamily protein
MNSIVEFREYRRTTRREFIKERDNLATLYNTINLKLISHGMPTYIPPQGLSVDDTAGVIDSLAQAEAGRRTNLYNKLREIQERVQKVFAELANGFHDKCTQYKSIVTSLQGSLEDQLQLVLSNQPQLSELDPVIPQLTEAEDNQTKANVEVNNYTDHTTDDLSFELEQLKRFYQKSIELIRGQISAQQTTSIDSKKIEEIRQTFIHFDVNGDNQLSRLELKSALSSLGLIELNFDGTDKIFENYFHELSKGTDQVQFEDYAQFMAARETTGKVDVNQLKDSFQNLSGGRQYITENDLRSAGVDQNTIEYVTLNFAPTQGGYDFNGYLGKTFK